MSKQDIQEQWNTANQQITKANNNFALGKIVATCGAAIAFGGAFVMNPLFDASVLVMTGGLLVMAAGTFWASHNFVRARGFKKAANSLCERLEGFSHGSKRPKSSTTHRASLSGAAPRNT